MQLVFKKSKLLNSIVYLMILLQITEAQNNCLVLQSTNIYGGQRSNFQKCFDIQIDNLTEIIVHTKSNVVGFTFNFNDGKIISFLETSGSTNNYTIDLIKNELIGANIFIGEGIEGLQFQLYNFNTNNVTLSEMMGQSIGCFSYFNSSSMKINYLKVDSIHGCVDDKNSNYFPFLSFSNSFSQCPFRQTSTILISGTSAVTTESTTSSTATVISGTSTVTTESTTSSTTTLSACSSTSSGK